MRFVRNGGYTMAFRIEHDSMGEMKVPAEKYWGAQTQRSYQNFKIGGQKIPQGFIMAMAIVKKAAAMTNYKLGKLEKHCHDLIIQVCDEILSGALNDHFPLVVWQTGSGTQTNMNFNEVIANRGNEIAQETVLHPNDHVNMSQSSNDTFPTAMNIASVISIFEELFPALDNLQASIKRLVDKYEQTLKIGRTHLQDATPLTFGQEAGGWLYSLQQNKRIIESQLEPVYEIALGGTAVGTGINTPEGYSEMVANHIEQITGHHFITSPNKFHALSSKGELANLHGGLKTLAADLMKIANDIRWLASGPRCGIGEITLPSNEPGSSIMPGKVNPTQCEAMTMIAAQVMGNDTTVSIAASQGNFELNVYMPVIIFNILQSVTLLADTMNSFNTNCVAGIVANEAQMMAKLQDSLMLVTRLSPYIGYEKAAKTAQKAFEDNITLRQACLELGFLSIEDFDSIMKPEAMI